MSDERPVKLPMAWPSKGSTLRNETHGWTLRHKDRDPLVFKEGRWIPLAEQVAA